jgi:hypothetical protein
MAGSYHFVIAMWRTKEAQLSGVKRSWEIIAENISKAGWSWGCVSAVDSNGRTIWIADAHRDDGKRLVVRSDEKLTAFLELARMISTHLLTKDSEHPTAGQHPSFGFAFLPAVAELEGVR